MKPIYFLSLLVFNSIFSQTAATISIPEHRYQIDRERKLIVSHMDISKISTNTGASMTIEMDKVYTFIQTPLHLSHSESYTITDSQDIFTLYFTKLPLISIQAPQEIVDEPKREAFFTYADEEEIITSTIGIEIRGAGSLRFPKKNFDLEFWEDATTEESRDVKFGKLRNDDDWILDGMSNEPLRLRSFVSHKIWLDMHEPYYKEEEEKAQSGVDLMYSEVFLNNSYIGLYALSEQIDRKLLRLKKDKDDQIRGELYKAVRWANENSRYLAAPEYRNDLDTWGDQEWKYPDEKNLIDWKNLWEATSFVVNAPQSEFEENIGSYFKYENIMDYYLFLNGIRAMDNHGNNIYLGKYTTDEPYFMIPWDLDATFGSRFTGERENIFNDIRRNNLLDRWFIQTSSTIVKNQLSDRWQELRNSVFDSETIRDTFTSLFTDFTENKIYEREALVWNQSDYSDQELDYILTWYSNRMQFLDEVFNFKTLSTIKNQSGIEGIQIIQMPNSNTFLINRDTDESTNLIVYSIVGKVLQRSTISTAKSQFIISQPRGVYIVKVGNLTTKLIKQ